MDRILKYIVVSVFFLIGFAFTGNAQFKEEAFTQTYNDPADTTGMKDTTDKLFSIKEFIGGLAHKNTLKIGTMFAGSVVLPGTAQIYNKQYWKLPILYSTFGTGLGMFIYENSRYKPLKREFDALTNKGLSRTPELDHLQRNCRGNAKRRSQLRYRRFRRFR